MLHEGESVPVPMDDLLRWKSRLGLLHGHLEGIFFGLGGRANEGLLDLLKSDINTMDEVAEWIDALLIETREK